MINKILFFLAKTNLIGSFVGTCFEYLGFFIPVTRIIETNLVLTFYHPKPSFKNHIVIVPKKNIFTFLHFHNENNLLYLLSIFSSAINAIYKLEFKTDICNLCVNGGLRQEVQIVHFHLYTEIPPFNLLTNCINENFTHDIIFENSIARAFNHPNPNWEIHVIIVFKEEILESSSMNEKMFFCKNLLDIASKLNQIFNLEAIGYTIYFNEIIKYKKYSTCYIVAGKELSQNKYNK